VKNSKNKVAKELTKNQRIVYLIEKYEKRQGSGAFIASKDLPIDDGDMMEFQEEEKGDFSQRRMSNGST
jgi:hypothetical protein